MHAYAQTNVQLFNQLRSEGYTKQDRERVRAAYEFAMRLFAGLFLPSGKTFIDHLVGTASILVSLHVPVELVTAGLIHAAYLHGNFGGIRKGISVTTRKQVRLAVGEKVEEYVVRYERMLWDPQPISFLRDTFDGLDAVDRDVLLMRLANELEHNLDLGSLYRVGREDWYQRYIESYGPIMVGMAERLGFSSLSAEMANAFRNITSAQIPLQPCMRDSHPAAHLIVPKSYHERFWVVYLPKANQLYLKILNRTKRLYRKASKLRRYLLRTAS
jgi:(p)ppGpp synthase/HD superfamily hydrolase